MRTTLTLDDDVLAAAREIAEVQRVSLGEVISRLARRALEPVPAGAVRNGIPLLPVRPDTPRVSSELVHQLREELT